MTQLRQSDCRRPPRDGAVNALVLGVLALFALFSAQASADERPAAARIRELASQQKVLENKLTLIQRMLDASSDENTSRPRSSVTRISSQLWMMSSGPVG